MSKDVYADIAALKAKHKKAKLKKLKVPFPNLTCRDEKHALSNNIELKGGYRKDLRTEHRWKRDRQESAATVKEIDNKAKRIRPHFNKGGYQYATDGDNMGEIRVYRK